MVKVRRYNHKLYGHKVTDVRLMLLRFVKKHSPIVGDTAIEMLGMVDEVWFRAVAYCTWFEITGKGWKLSREGQQYLDKLNSKE